MASEFWQQESMFVSPTGKSVERIPKEQARQVIEKIHYSKAMPNNTTDAFGLFIDGELAGVVTYGVPAAPGLCKGLAGPENADHIKELNRLVIIGGGGYNLASYLISHSLKMLEGGTFVVSFADPAWTHVGYVYQASNFLYTGLSAKRIDTYQPTGIHPRSYDKTNHSELRQTRTRKHRYVYLVGDRRQRKRMRSELRYPVYDTYPKGDEIRYDVNDPKIVHPIHVIGYDEKEVDQNGLESNA